jgi:hypothetical protein
MTTSELTCPVCGFRLSDLHAEVHLDRKSHGLFCPVCRGRITDEFAHPPVFFDREDKDFIIWDPAPEASGSEPCRVSLSPRLVVYVHGKRRNPRDLCYPYVLAFEWAGKPYLPRLPVRPSELRYLNIKECGEPSLTGDQYQIILSLKGGYSQSVVLPACLHIGELARDGKTRVNVSALRLWPNFRRVVRVTANERIWWSDYFIYFQSNDGLLDLDRIVVFDEQWREIAAFQRPFFKGRVQGVPEWVEVKASDKQLSQERPCAGLFAVPLETLPAAIPEASPSLLAMDFGTTYTCFYGEPSGGKADAIRFADRSVCIVDGLRVAEETNSTWFPQFGGNRDNNLLPSEILLEQPFEKLEEGLDKLKPITHYTIAPPYDYPESPNVVSGFKWKGITYVAAEAGAGFGVVPRLIKEVEKLQELYLRLAVRMALAELAGAERNLNPGAVDCAVTFPLAFSEAQLRDFEEVCGRVFSSLSQEAGVNLQLRHWLDESQAGARGARGMPPGPELITIDVGGGTTDFVSISRVPDVKPIFSDSVRYAGDHYLSRLVAPSGLELTVLTGRNLVQLHRDVLIRGASNVFDARQLETFQNDAARWRSSLRGIERYVAGLVELAARLVAARLRVCGTEVVPERITVLLLGNGWRFASALSNEEGNEFDKTRLYIQAQVRQVLEKVYRQRGIIAHLPPVDFYYPRDAKLAVAKGALRSARSVPHGGPLEEPQHQASGRLAFAGCNLRISDVAGRNANVQWDAMLPIKVSQFQFSWDLIQCVAGDFEFEKQTVFDSQNRSVPPESINLMDDRLIEPGAKEIRNNVLGFVLEKYYSNSFFIDMAKAIGQP